MLHVFLGVDAPYRRREALRPVAAGALSQAINLRREGITRGFNHQACRLGALGIAQQDAVHAGRERLLDHPGIGPQSIGGAGQGERDDDRRGFVAGARRARVDQTAHEIAQFLEIERTVLHFIGDVVGLGRRHLLAFFIAAAADLRVIDRLILEPHVDDAVDMFACAGCLRRHGRDRRIARRHRLLGADRHGGEHGGNQAGHQNYSRLHGILP